MTNATESTSTRPYLIRALYEWCTDNGLTPYVAVQVDDSVQVPREYVKNGEIVLNIGLDATSSLTLGNDFLEFKARFAGSAREIMVPMDHVIAIYARENGQGMAFPAPSATGAPASMAPMPAGALREAPPREGEANALHLVGAEEGAASEPVPLTVVETSSEDPVPPRPPAGGGARPSLKRIK